jgi:polyisoprenoid-binding protein YceI
VFKRAAAAVLILCVAACVSPRPRPAAPQSAQPPGVSAQSLPAPGAYQIDSSESELRLLVYRAGPLANLGHNHVMVNHHVTGLVQIGSNISNSSFSLEVPVDDFVVDDAQARREEGGDFPGEIPEDAKSGTRRNMLGPALLNAAEYPAITVNCTAIDASAGALTAYLTIRVAGQEAKVTAPFTLNGDGRHLTATGSIELRQTAIGLKPYSLMRGALQVQDAVQLKFRIAVLIG